LRKILQYALILVIMTLVFSAYGQNTAEVDTSLAAPVDTVESAEPAVFNEYLGQAVDTAQVFLEFALNNEAMAYIGWNLGFQVRTQDIWKNSRGSVVAEYYSVGEDGEWMKINPATILRVNGKMPGQ